MFTLAHLSDPHLSPLPQPRCRELVNKRATGYFNWQHKRRFIHNRAVLDRIVSDLKAQEPNHIAVTGDIVNIALAAEYGPGREWLDGLGRSHDVSFVPGNHDAYVRSGVGFAERSWAAHMAGDAGGGFPYLRRRGPLALVGLSTAVPSAPFMATGRLGKAQLAALAELLDKLADGDLFRVILIHHPPVSEAGWHKRLTDADAFMQVIAAHGADLLLHGHDHRQMLNWLPGPQETRVPVVGVPSASAAPGMAKDAGAYNLYRIEGSAGAWSCELIGRHITASGKIGELKEMKLTIPSR